MIGFAAMQTLTMAIVATASVRGLGRRRAARAARGRRVSLLRRPGLGPLLTAEVVSSLGSQMTYLALPWFVLVTTRLGLEMGIVLGVEPLPIGSLRHPERRARREARGAEDDDGRGRGSGRR